MPSNAELLDLERVHELEPLTENHTGILLLLSSWNIWKQLTKKLW